MLKLGSLTSAPQGAAPGGSSRAGWHPTIAYLLVLVVAEMFAFGLVARLLK